MLRIDGYRPAQIAFIIAGLLGLLGSVGIGIFFALLVQKEAMPIIFGGFFLGLLWCIFSVLAYKGMFSKNWLLVFIYWIYIAASLINIPIGTIFAIIIMKAKNNARNKIVT